jgi:putative endonuclease
MSNFKRTTFYIGVTNDLQKREAEHKAGVGSVFTKRYKLYYLVYFERILDIEQAIKRETQLKNWKRSWKIDLIDIGLPVDSESSSE